MKESVEQGQNEEQLFRASLRILREKRGLSQNELAKRLTDAGLPSFHGTTIKRIEDGDRVVRLSELTPIATALGVTPDQMLYSGEDLEALIRAQKINEYQRETVDQLSKTLTLFLRDWIFATSPFLGTDSVSVEVENKLDKAKQLDYSDIDNNSLAFPHGRLMTALITQVNRTLEGEPEGKKNFYKLLRGYFKVNILDFLDDCIEAQEKVINTPFAFEERSASSTRDNENPNE